MSWRKKEGTLQCPNLSLRLISSQRHVNIMPSYQISENETKTITLVLAVTFIKQPYCITQPEVHILQFTDSVLNIPLSNSHNHSILWLLQTDWTVSPNLAFLHKHSNKNGIFTSNVSLQLQPDCRILTVASMPVYRSCRNTRISSNLHGNFSALDLIQRMKKGFA